MVTAFDVLYHITNDDKFCAAIKNIAHVLKPGGYLFLTDILFSSQYKISPQQHVRWRSLSYYEQELKRNGLDIIYLAPVYCLLMSPVGASGLLGKMLNIIYYSLTCRLTSKSKTFPIIEKTYLTALYYFDSFLTSSSRFDVSTKLLVVKKRG